MYRSVLAVIAAMLLTCGLVAPTVLAADQANTDRKASVSYGRIKEMTPAKIVVDIANWPDKSFDLTDREKTFHVGAGLKVGDPVMISERKINGKDVVDITEHSGGGVKHGAKTREEEVKDPKK